MTQYQSLVRILLAIFIGSDLRLDRLPIDLDVLGELQEPLVGLLFSEHLQVSLPVRNHGIHVRLVLHGNLKGFVPFVALDVQLDGSVEEAGTQKDLFGLVELFAVQSQRRIAAGLRWELLYVVDELHFVRLVDSS